MRYSNIISAIAGDVWAIHPEKMDAILGVIEARQAGIVLSTDKLEAAEKRRSAAWGVKGSVAVMGLYGTITHRPSAFSSGGVSAQEFGAEFQRYIDDPSIGAIVLDVDSPGGSVFGLQELVDRIYAARGRKPIEAVANAMAASAAYDVASAVDRLSVTPSGMVGSVGCLCVHTDTTAAEEQAGIKYEYVTSAPYKAESHQSALSDEHRQHLQQMVDTYHRGFVGRLARNFGVSVETVDKTFGQGRMVMAQQAKERGMVHAIATLEDVVERLQRPRGRSSEAARARLHTLTSPA